MPAFEMSIIYRLMAKPELASVMKRTAEALLEQGCVLKKIENLGCRNLPHKMSAHDHLHTKGNQILYHYEGPQRVRTELLKLYQSDTDIVRTHITVLQPHESPETCTYHDENVPVPYRPEVIDLVEKSRYKNFTRRRYTFDLGGRVNPFS